MALYMGKVKISGSGSGNGTVKSVNQISPDLSGNVDLSCFRCETFNFYTKEDPTTPIPYHIILSAV